MGSYLPDIGKLLKLGLKIVICLCRALENVDYLPVSNFTVGCLTSKKFPDQLKVLAKIKFFKTLGLKKEPLHDSIQLLIYLKF